jgi:epoxide hydrolase-like predicted phosphatase
MIKWIIFDFGRVLFNIDYKSLFENVKNEFPELTKENIQDILFKKLGQQYRCGKYTPKEFWQEAKKLVGKDFDTKKMARIWHSSYQFNQEMFELVTKLKKNFKIGVISGNTLGRVQYHDDKHHFSKYFDEMVFSYEVSVNKPGLDMYTTFLERTKAKPEECVFIDDNEPFLKPAAALGMKTIQYQNPKQLKEDLKQFGITLQ